MAHRWLRVALFSVTVVAVAAGLVVAGGTPETIWGFPGSSAVWALGFFGAGFLADRAKPENPIGLLLMLAGASAALQEFVTQFVANAGAESGAGVGLLAQLLGWSWMLPASLLITTVLRFPNGDLLGARWRWVERGLWVAVALMAVTSTFTPPSDDFPFDNPLQIARWSNGLVIASNVAYVLWQLTSIPAIASVIVRLRRARGIERQQVKWVAFAAGYMAFLVFGVEVIFRLFFEPLYESASALVALSVLLIPISMALAMLRYRLYDVDRLVSRSVAYSLLAVALFLVYGGGVVFLQSALPTSGNLAIAASTLAAAALFNPLRVQVQRWVDRRFNRAAFDAEREVDDFAQRLRSALDPATITRDLNVVLQSTVQPASTFVWIRNNEAG